VLLTNERAQAAAMNIGPGGAEGGPANRHRGADQWLYVIAGKGVAMVGRQRTSLRTGSLVLIERGRTHEIKNIGTTPLRTLNFYVSPAYTRAGKEKAAGRS